MPRPIPRAARCGTGPRLFHQPTCHHRPELFAGVGEREAAAQLRAFFAERGADGEAPRSADPAPPHC